MIALCVCVGVWGVWVWVCTTPDNVCLVELDSVTGFLNS